MVSFTEVLRQHGHALDGDVAIEQRNPIIFRQLFEHSSSTYTYLIADAVTKEALLIDPVLETVER